MDGRLTPTVGLVAPLPPQIGGVAGFAEWLLAHEAEIGCRFVPFDLERPVGAPSGGRPAVGELARQVVFAARFAAWVRRAPRVVHVCVSYTTSGLLRDLAYVALLRLSGRRVIAHVHGGSLVPGEASARARLVRLVSRLAATTVTIGPSSAAALATLGIRAEWVMNPVRVAAPTNGKPPGSDGEGLRVLFAGTYGRRKGTAVLLRAVRTAREAGAEIDLVLAGKEEYRGEEAELRALADELGVARAVSFEGVVAADGLADLYARADAFCLPSRSDGVPMALLEAMSFALPVVASRVGGIGDLVADGETGYLVEPGDDGAVADALGRLAASAELRRRTRSRRPRTGREACRAVRPDRALARDLRGARPRWLIGNSGTAGWWPRHGARPRRRPCQGSPALAADDDAPSLGLGHPRRHPNHRSTIPRFGRPRSVVRIALVHPEFHLAGSLARDRVQLARGLTERGHDVHVYANPARRTVDLPGVVPHDVRTPFSSDGRLGRPLEHLAFARAATSQLRRERAAYDLVDVSGTSAWEHDVVRVHAVQAAEQRRWPVEAGRSYRAARLRAALAPVSHPIVGVARALERLQFRSGRYREVAAVSERVADDLVLVHGVPRERISVVPYPIDLERFRDVEANGIRGRLGVDGDERLLLFVGHDFERKGLSEAIGAVAGLPDAHLAVVGRGPQREYEAAARRAGVAGRVHFVGGTEEPERLFAAADLFLLPTRNDVWGIAILEALAAGVPVVTTEAAGAADVVRSSAAGVVLANGDPRPSRRRCGRCSPTRRGAARWGSEAGPPPPRTASTPSSTRPWPSTSGPAGGRREARAPPLERLAWRRPGAHRLARRRHAAARRRRTRPLRDEPRPARGRARRPGGALGRARRIVAAATCSCTCAGLPGAPPSSDPAAP